MRPIIDAIALKDGIALVHGPKLVVVTPEKFTHIHPLSLASLSVLTGPADLMVYLTDWEAAVCQPRRESRRVVIASEIVTCLSIVLYTLISEDVVGQPLKTSLFTAVESEVASGVRFVCAFDLLLREAKIRAEVWEVICRIGLGSSKLDERQRASFRRWYQRPNSDVLLFLDHHSISFWEVVMWVVRQVIDMM